MKAVVQRVTKASVTVDGKIVGQIADGLMILLGVAETDEQTDADWLAQKIANLRIFSDEEGKMNKSVLDVDGQILVVSQFTLIAEYAKGNRPAFIKAAKPEKAVPLYEYFLLKMTTLINKSIEKGIFGADMDVCIYNQGPVTIVLDTITKQ
jgi:D-tyrosyl-tRNA(Tyr) deacylase